MYAKYYHCTRKPIKISNKTLYKIFFTKCLNSASILNLQSLCLDVTFPLEILDWCLDVLKLAVRRVDPQTYFNNFQ